MPGPAGGRGLRTHYLRGPSKFHMEHFSVGQRWITRDDIFGTFLGEVIEVSDYGRLGVVIITDDQGNEVDTFRGSAADFQASGKWQLAD